MLDGIEALIALEKFGTVSEAATRLRLTQSAVSKRIHGLQNTVGYKLVEPHGRRVRLTASGIRLLERARPLVAELRALATPAEGQTVASLSIVMADSIAASWGPAVIRRTLERVSGMSLDLHAHRSVLLIESLRLGRYHIGLGTDIATVRDLIRYPVVDEPMVLVNCGCARKPAKDLPLITIEQGSATWRALEGAMRKEQPELYRRARIGVESFSAAVQMVRAKFGDGLVPLGLARELKVDPRCCRVAEGLTRKVVLYTRKTVNQTATFAAFREALAREAAALFR